MKLATFILVIAGVVLLAGAIWGSLVSPLRSETQQYDDFVRGRYTGTVTIYCNLWGQPLSMSTHRFFQPDEGEEVGMEVVMSGAVMAHPKLGLSWRGPCEVKSRDYKQPWVSKTLWYLDGELVTREEWERRK